MTHSHRCGKAGMHLHGLRRKRGNFVDGCRNASSMTLQPQQHASQRLVHSAIRSQHRITSVTQLPCALRQQSRGPKCLLYRRRCAARRAWESAAAVSIWRAQRQRRRSECACSCRAVSAFPGDIRAVCIRMCVFSRVHARRCREMVVRWAEPGGTELGQQGPKGGGETLNPNTWMLLYLADTVAKYSEAAFSLLKNRPMNLIHSARFRVPAPAQPHFSGSRAPVWDGSFGPNRSYDGDRRRPRQQRTKHTVERQVPQT